MLGGVEKSSSHPHTILNGTVLGYATAVRSRYGERGVREGRYISYLSLHLEATLTSHNAIYTLS